MTTEALNTSWEYPPELQQQIDALIISFLEQKRGDDPELLTEIEKLLNANGFAMPLPLEVEDDGSVHSKEHGPLAESLG